MVGGRWTRFVAFVAIATAFSACYASIACAEGEEDTGGFGAFRLRGTNDYSILVLALSRPHFKHGEILVWAAKAKASVIYLAPATVTATTIEADLGSVGGFSLGFEPSGSTERVNASCKRGGSVTFEPGSWVGKIELAGEEGFTRAQAVRAKAIPNPFVDFGCGSVLIGESTGARERGARLVARSAAGKQALFLQANQNHPRARVHLEADLEERHGRVIVDREVAGYFPASSLRFDPRLRSAVLAPASPFSGTASFHRNARPGNRWTGNLALDFPGRANVPLVGRSFKAALVRARRTREVAHHDRLARPNPIAFMLAGSMATGTIGEAGAGAPAASLPPE
jgi:hypothetical protein